MVCPWENEITLGIAFYSDTLRDSYGPGTVEGHGARWKNQDKCNAIPQEILGKQTSDGSDGTVEEILSACRSFTGAHMRGNQWNRRQGPCWEGQGLGVQLGMDPWVVPQKAPLITAVMMTKVFTTVGQYHSPETCLGQSQKRAPSLTGWLTLAKFRDLMDKPGDARTLKDEENLICPASILPNHQVHCKQKTCEGPNAKGQGVVSLFFLQKARKM